MRILITNQINYADGGMQTYLGAIAKLLELAGHEIRWLIGKLSEVDVYFPDLEKRNYWAIDRQARPEIMQAIRKWQPDVVYSHGLEDTSWDEWLVTWVPVVFFLHGYSGACISGTKCHSRFGSIQVCERNFSPACLFLYLPFGCGGQSPLTMLKQYGAQRNYGRKLAKLSKLLVASNHMLAVHARQGLPREKLEVLSLFPTGIEPIAVLPKQADWHNRVLLLSRLTKHKGVQIAVSTVLRASKILGRTLTLRVVGEGPMMQCLRDEASNLNVPTEFVGQVHPDARLAVMHQVDAMLFPSLWPEPFGLAGIEAGCQGIPAVGFPVGGVSEWLIDGQTGVMANANRMNADSLGDALATCLGSWERFQNMRVRSWQMAKEFSVEGHIARLTSLFLEAVHEFRPSAV